MAEPYLSTKGQSNLPRWFSEAFALVQGIKAGRVDLILPDGRLFRAEGPVAGPHGVIQVRDGAMFSRLLREGELGFAESYMDGEWDTPDLQAVLDVLLLSNEEVGREMPGAKLVRLYERLRHRLRANSKAQARKNISHHYDLGNDFYEMWLDETMTYSSAMFDTQANTLAAAQTRKYDHLCDVIGVKPGDHILEIGCGWGGFAEHAAKMRGARVTGLTISREQHDYAQKRMQMAGLSDSVDIVMRDYRDERGSYDGIASIEMFEAVGEKYWPQYFEIVRDRLNPAAIAGLQIITVSDHLFEGYRKGVDFIQKYIFPGGMLPSVSALRQEIGAAGLTEASVKAFGDSYSQTLRRWHVDFNGSWGKIEKLGFDERFARMWNFYLTSCAACFMAGTTDVIQIGVRHEI